MDHRKRRAYVTILWKPEANCKMRKMCQWLINSRYLRQADLVLVILYGERNPPFNSTHRINVNEWKLFTWMRRTKINLNMPYVDAFVNSEDI
jgi:hypothetical protein